MILSDSVQRTNCGALVLLSVLYVIPRFWVTIYFASSSNNPRENPGFQGSPWLEASALISMRIWPFQGHPSISLRLTPLPVSVSIFVLHHFIPHPSPDTCSPSSLTCPHLNPNHFLIRSYSTHVRNFFIVTLPFSPPSYHPSIPSLPQFLLNHS